VTQKSTVLVVGAGGMLGQTVSMQLGQAGYRVRALLRPSTPEAKVAALSNAGSEIVIGDLRDAASLRAACDGVTAIVSTATAMMAPDGNDTLREVDGAGQVELVRAARAEQIERFVYVSLFDLPKLAEQPVPLEAALLDGKRRVERELMDSGVPYTIVRPAFFREIWLSSFLGFDPANDAIALYGTGEQLVSFIALEDVARFCVGALASTQAHNQLFELGGPDPISLLDAAKLACPPPRQPTFSRLSIEDIRAQIRQLLTTDGGKLVDSRPVETSRLALLQRFAEGLVPDNTRALTAVPLTLQPVSSFLQGMATSK